MLRGMIEELAELYMDSARLVTTLEIGRVGPALSIALQALDQASRSVSAARALRGSLDDARIDLDHAQLVVTRLRGGGGSATR